MTCTSETMYGLGTPLVSQNSAATKSEVFITEDPWKKHFALASVPKHAIFGSQDNILAAVSLFPAVSWL